MNGAVWLLFAAYWELFLCGVDGACDAKTCSENFFSQTDQLARESKKFCVYLNAYDKCLELQKSSCRGDLGFYGTRSSVEILMAKHPHCKAIVFTDDDRQKEADALSNLLQDGYHGTSPNKDVCKYSGSGVLSHCALVGNSHLVTFNENYMTCLIKGAWPLLSTRHVAVQVTNRNLYEYSKTTTITQVTVIIKSVSESCGPGVTYEASEDLPKAFVNGRTWAPAGWITEVTPGQHVVIHVVAINATIAIRKIDRLLQVHLTLPVEVEDTNMDDFSLCASGCPIPQQININEHVLKSPLNETQAKSICIGYNLTDHYLDSCMFDVMTTGDTTFAKAAFLGHEDMTHLNPYFRIGQRNCTAWPCEASTSEGNMLNFNFMFICLVLIHLR